MKNKKNLFCLILASAMLVTLLVGCGTDGEEPADDESTGSISASGNPAGGGPTESGTGADAEFSHSGGIDENGFWTGINALDYVVIFNYQAMAIPNDVHQISDDAIQSEIDYLLTQFPSVTQIMDRAVVDGDTVNIDYVGSIDGVEFENGSTNGMGTDVTIGLTSYIDDFLEQLIGHAPGDVVNVEVTFPIDYYEVSLQGKDALFITTVNYIVEDGDAELTDAFVLENLFVYFGWTSVEDMRSGIHERLYTDALEQHIRQYFINEVTVNEVPDRLVEYQLNSLLDYYENYALYYYGVDLESFIVDYNGFSGVDEFVETMHDEIIANATYYLIIQAIAEDAGFSVSLEDISDFFMEQYGSDDYSSYEEQFGMPYLKQVVLSQIVIDYIVENAILLNA